MLCIGGLPLHHLANRGEGTAGAAVRSMNPDGDHRAVLTEFLYPLLTTPQYNRRVSKKKEDDLSLTNSHHVVTTCGGAC
ncbi:MAG: hypothetical protein Kow00124_27780 [Anaerolineae bacterium]